MRFTRIMAVTNNLIAMRRARRMESILPNNLPFDVLVEWEPRRYYPFDVGGPQPAAASRMESRMGKSNGNSHIRVEWEIIHCGERATALFVHHSLFYQTIALRVN